MLLFLPYIQAKNEWTSLQTSNVKSSKIKQFNVVIKVYNKNKNKKFIIIIISEYIITKNPTSVWNGSEGIMEIGFSSFDICQILLILI